MSTHAKPTLLTLPPELRNKILHLATTRPSPLHPTTSPFHPDPAAPPSLARTNTQLRREVLPIFYGTHTLEFDLSATGPRALHTWTTMTPYATRIASHIRLITFRDDVEVGERVDMLTGEFEPLCLPMGVAVSVGPDGKGVKVGYLGAIDGICACEVEAVVGEMVREGRGILEVAEEVRKRAQGVVWADPWRRPEERGVGCACGVVGS